ncbi:MAG: deoxyguanosinetriphosphate triphosphohydrolase [Clostridiales Family XIII bacterium]|jgi:dGTPase|nr:deoxyguanosinetriphosphate triphosphohydrolase [Clostridiales Family XIII bacterium]
MLDRNESEKREYEILSEYAAKARDSKGRRRAEGQCAYRTVFQRDRDRIIHAKAFRRLMHKTQVFLAPEGDHFRTRLTHTLEVSQIARSIARALRLNEDLTEAIALGHDLGHTPFGHIGENALALRHEGGFRHNVQSLRVVDVLESNDTRRGMNLTAEVRDGILHHTGMGIPMTLEGRVVKTADRIAYINHDIDDALRSGVIAAADLPAGPTTLLGATTTQRIDSLIRDMIESSDGKADILQSEAHCAAMNELRGFLFENVYLNKRVKEDGGRDIDEIIFGLYDYYLAHPEELPIEYAKLLSDESGPAEIVKDHIASMTDRFARETWTGLR